jgi:hypothetical protein
MLRVSRNVIGSGAVCERRRTASPGGRARIDLRMTRAEG